MARRYRHRQPSRAYVEKMISCKVLKDKRVPACPSERLRAYFVFVAIFKGMYVFRTWSIAAYLSLKSSALAGGNAASRCVWWGF
jgi:hypothetical protein